MPRWRAVTEGVIASLLAVACAAPGAVRKEEASADASRGDVRQTVEELRREVAELRAQLQAHRWVAARQDELAGLRDEVLAVQAALQALVRDVEQRQREALEAVERRLATVATRLGALESAERATPAAPPDVGPRPEAGETPPPAVPRPSVIRRVQPSQAASEATVGVEADGPLGARAFSLADPTRLVVDFDNAAYGLDRTPVTVGGPMLDRIRFIQLRGQPSPISRLVLYLRRPVPHWIESQPHGVVIHLGTNGPPR
ncbi:MAG TPA: AMIN domain-containing protein [Methylomirabilota bacterium]|jgi:hypothetical protein|nr:AMIN domain-containing protein [Methylomirabilota bacterium]